MSSLCQICKKNPATSHLCELDESGHLQELHICNSCTTRLDLDLSSDPPPIQQIVERAAAADQSNNEPIVNIDADETAVALDITDETGLACTSCGISFEQFSKNNRFGCAKDYEAFSSELSELFDELHGSHQHLGRGPVDQQDARNQVLAKRIRLEKRLQDVIAEERFEEAARIRDQLKELDS